jgi:hypothetical protein
MRREEFLKSSALVLLLVTPLARALGKLGPAELAPAPSTVPTGFVCPFPVTGPVPKGWLRCDGSRIPPGLYRNLHAAIGNTFGRNRLPDLRGRVPVAPSRGMGQIQSVAYDYIIKT